ncbi:MAG: prepilin-type N-terminal cleavage/methylation domain-containing protein [Lentisphaeria bacterium]|jgi:hypothetical protein
MATPRQRRYTLLELLLAVAIFALLLLAAGFGIAAVQKSWETVSRHSRRLAECQAIDTAVGLAFRNAVPFTWPDRDSRTERPVFSGDPATLLLAYRHRVGDAAAGGLRFLCLYVQDNELRALYRPRPFAAWLPPPATAADTQEEALAEGVEAISFLYADRSGNEIRWTNDWDEGKNPNLPLAIQLEVRWQDGQVERWLRRTAGGGRRTSHGVRLEAIP